MRYSFGSAASEGASALVIVFPPDFRGLFNPEIHGLVREVQEHLDGVYVTYATTSGVSPDLTDAMAAARFLGCSSAVIVQAKEGDHAGLTSGNFDGDRMLTSSRVAPELGAPAVVEAYLQAVSEAEMAA
jgi:hypothetical protein